MRYNVEIRVNHCEIADRGRDAAMARATFEAWYITLKENHPVRSITLVSSEFGRYQEMFISHPEDYRCRFQFDVDLDRNVATKG